MNILGGLESNLFQYFKILFLQGFTVLKKYADDIVNILAIMCIDSHLPCFKNFDMREIVNSCGITLTDKDREEFVETLIYESLNSRKTYFYDTFQRYSNNIMS